MLLLSQKVIFFNDYVPKYEVLFKLVWMIDVFSNINFNQSYACGVYYYILLFIITFFSCIVYSHAPSFFTIDMYYNMKIQAVCVNGGQTKTGTKNSKGNSHITAWS